MGLAERINPEREALCIAVDKKIYVWAYEKPQHLITSRGAVRSLATKNQRLVFCDGWGIRDTLEKTVSDEWPWNKIATDPSGRLFGTMDPAFSGMMGAHGQLIFDVESQTPVARRNGDTTLLAGNPFLIDAGDYYHSFGEKDGALYDTLRNKIVAAGTFQGIETYQGVAPSAQPGRVYVALNTQVALRKLGEPDPATARMLNMMLKGLAAQGETPPQVTEPEQTTVFSISSPAYEKYRQMIFSGADFVRKHLDGGDTSQEWDALWAAVDGIRQYVSPKTFKLKYHARKPALQLKHVPYKDAEAYYSPIVKAIHEARAKGHCEHEHEEDLFDEQPEEETALAIPLNAIVQSAHDQLYDKYGIRSLAKCNNQLAIGLGTGELVLKDPNSGNDYAYVVWHFGKPITALLTVPIETFNDGIKQHVLENIRRRAYFAGHGKVYKFDGIPKPLRKAI